VIINRVMIDEPQAHFLQEFLKEGGVIPGRVARRAIGKFSGISGKSPA